MMGDGQGASIVAVAAMPLVLESACRARVVTPDEMKSFRKAWSRVKALVSINPSIMSLNSEIDLVRRALPEFVKVQPSGVYREVLSSQSRTYKEFARELGALVAAPRENDRFKVELLRQALEALSPVYFEDESGNVGLCCVL